MVVVVGESVVVVLDVVVGEADMVVVVGAWVVVGTRVVTGGWVVVGGAGVVVAGAAVVVGGGAEVVGNAQMPLVQTLGERQHAPLQQGPAQHPSSQQFSPGPQHGVRGSCMQTLALQQHIASPMQIAPSGQHSPSQH